MKLTMTFWIRVEDCVYEEYRRNKDISSRDKELLTAALIKHVDSMHQWEFIAEHSNSYDLPLCLSDVIQNCNEDERERLPESIKRLINLMINGAVEYGKKQIEDALDAERRYQGFERSTDKGIARGF